MSFEAIHYFNLLTGAGVILLQIVCVVVLGMLLFGPKEDNKVLDFIKEQYLWIGFLLSLSAVLVSGVYSEVIGYAPCLHCWIDRIFIFPQAILFLIAAVRKDKNIFWYSMALTLFGLANALYHMYIYYFSEGSGPCDASGISCVQRLVSEFGGYISIPMDALTGFVALLVLLLVVRFYKKNNI